MKKNFFIILAAVLLFGLSGCGSTADQPVVQGSFEIVSEKTLPGKTETVQVFDVDMSVKGASGLMTNSVSLLVAKQSEVSKVKFAFEYERAEQCDIIVAVFILNAAGEYLATFSIPDPEPETIGVYSGHAEFSADFKLPENFQIRLVAQQENDDVKVTLKSVTFTEKK